jgi:hypothetical protein
LPTEVQAGMDLIIAPFISKYVQKIHHHEGHFIIIDLFLPFNKLKNYQQYFPKANANRQKLQKFISFIITHINEAEKQHFKIIIMTI